MNPVKVYSVILDKGVSKYAGLLGDIVEKSVGKKNTSVYHMTCTHVDTSGAYLEAKAVSPSDGSEKAVYLSHALVVAILEVVNQQEKVGFTV